MKRRIWAGVIFSGSLLISACGVPASLPDPIPTRVMDLPATPTPIPASTAETITAERDGDYIEVPPGRNLVLDPSWECVARAERRGTDIFFGGGDDYQTPVNTALGWIKATKDFRIMARMETQSGYAGLVLFGRLPEWEWWQGVRRLEVGANDGEVSVAFYDGTEDNPSYFYTFEQKGIGIGLDILIMRENEIISIGLSNGQIHSFPDPGLTPDNGFFLGVNSSPSSVLQLSEIRLYAPPNAPESVEIQTPASRSPVFPANIPHPTLREGAAARGILIGGTASTATLGIDAYSRTLANHFNAFTAEWEMKMDTTMPAPDRFSFCAGDQLVEFAEMNEMSLRGHTLVWHEALPAWVLSEDYGREQWSEVFEQYIRTVVEHYRGKVYAWDVVNEAVKEDGSGLRETPWQQHVGADYLDQAFLLAEEADPDALLFYNDYGAEGMNAKADAVYELVRGMLARGVPIDGVGLQMHIRLEDYPDPGEVKANIDRLTQLGLQVQITEMDVWVGDTSDPFNVRQDDQAVLYQTMLSACLRNPDCTGFTTWGVSDQYSWLTVRDGPQGAPLLFDANFQPKPAYQAVLAALLP